METGKILPVKGESMNTESLGGDLRARRRDLKLSQRDAADLAGVSERFVRLVESGKATVRLDKLSALLEALGLELRAHVRSAS